MVGVNLEQLLGVEAERKSLRSSFSLFDCFSSLFLWFTHLGNICD